MKKRFTEEQIIGFLREAEAGIQRGTAEEIAGRPDALGLRQAARWQIGYITPRTLKPNATENRGNIRVIERLRATR